FSGVYGEGSAGNGDADFMRVITRAALSAWHSPPVVFDLRELDYQWGDAIWSVFGFGRGVHSSGVENLPRALVVSDLCRGGVSTRRGLVPAMFNDLETALAFVAEPARAELERLFAERPELGQLFAELDGGT